MDGLVAPLTVVTAVGSGLMAGLFFAFSVVVMPVLRRLPAEQGTRTMQLVNRTILNPLFLAVFLGSALAAAVLVVTVPFSDADDGRGWRLTGGLAYVVGVFVVTAAVNVPLNVAIDAVEPGTPEAQRTWATYVPRWTRWNHVRTVMSTAATALLVLSSV